MSAASYIAPSRSQWAVAVGAGLLAVTALLGGNLADEPPPRAYRVEALSLPPCPHCTQPVDVQLSPPRASERVFWWQNGYVCSDPCLD